MSQTQVSGESIADLLRRRIVEGRYLPGDRLPIRTALIRELGVCSSSLQKAQDALRQEGFVEAARRRGTFVAPRPPHLFHIGLTFDDNAADGRWFERTRFLYAIEREAAAISRATPWTIVPFTDVTRTRRTASEPSAMSDLNERVSRRRLAGVIVTNPYSLNADGFASDLPTVGFAGTHDPPTTCVVRLDPRRFIDRALGDLKSCGRKRVAMLTSSTAPQVKLDHLYRAAASRGLRAEAPWVQGVSLEEPHWALHAVRAIFMGRPSERPDALIVADEHLLEYALAGLDDQRVRVGRDVEVVTHCNFHWTPRPVSPVRRLGYATREVLEAAISLIVEHRETGQGRAVALEPRFEEELTDTRINPATVREMSDAKPRGDARKRSPRLASTKDRV